MNDATVLEPAVQLQLANGDDSLYEVVDGQRLELAPMSIYAALIATLLGNRLSDFVRANSHGRVVNEGLFILDVNANLRRRPDVAFVSAERWPLDRPIPEEGDWEVIPDLAVEVVSPNYLVKTVIVKLREYFLYGVRQVWLVIPFDKQVHVYSGIAQVKILTAIDSLDGSTLLPDFRLSLTELFQQ